MTRVLAALFAAIAPTTALAEPAPEDLVSFANLDRVGGVTGAGLLVGVPTLEDGFAARVELHGQYVSPIGLGGYAVLPISHISIDGEGTTGLASYELGATYTAPTSIPIVARAGISRSNNDEDFELFAAGFFSSFARPTDFASYEPGVTRLRLSGSTALRSKQLFAKLDLGADVPISDDGFGAETVYRLNAGVGFDVTEALAWTLELGTARVASCGGDSEDRCEIFVGVTARYQIGAVTPYVGLTFNNSEDEQTDAITDLSVLAGLVWTLPRS